MVLDHPMTQSHHLTYTKKFYFLPVPADCPNYFRKLFNPQITIYPLFRVHLHHLLPYTQFDWIPRPYGRKQTNENKEQLD
jgi:hypothetical protein